MVLRRPAGRILSLVTPRPPPARRVLPTSPFKPPSVGPAAGERLEAGDRVTHDRQGLGRVVRVVDDHDVIVDFGLPDGNLMTVSHLRLTKL
jgi:hypothetical protein